MGRNLDDDQIAEIQEIYTHFDRDLNGYIDREEFEGVLEALSAGMSKNELDTGFREVDSNHDQRISFEEFLAWWSDR